MYVEHNGKQGAGDPWSFRQTGSFHSFCAATRRNRVILLHPKENAVAQRRLENFTEFLLEADLAQHPLNTHLVVISSYLANWQDHIESLARELEQIVRSIPAINL